MDVSAMAPGSPEELRRFAEIQATLAPMFHRVFPDPMQPRTVVVIPSLSIDVDVLSRITGVQHYEERLLCMLMLLRFPRTRVIYVTSVPVDPWIIDYYLHLLPGIPSSHARKRLKLLSCHDASPVTVTKKILERPRLLNRIREAVLDPQAAHMTCFNATAYERSLAVRLGIPLYACDPALSDLGTKSGSREVFRAAGVPLPAGIERLRDEKDVAAALVDLKRGHPDLRRAVVKLEEGVSGEGNATFSYEGCPPGRGLASWVRSELPRRICFEAREETWDHFRRKLPEMGGVVECFVEGPEKRSPSVQCRIDPLGSIEMVSTHDQLLGGPSGQVFLGSTFPADDEYRLVIQEAGRRVAEVLRDRGVLGRFGVDFVSTRQEGRWEHFAIEINLRKGGTTHTFMTLQFLTDGTYDSETGLFRTPAGQPRYYHASDNLRNEHYRRLTPEDLIDIAVDHNLHFHGATQQGVAFHLIGALSEFGKLGMVCVADSPPSAGALYRHSVEVLDREALRDSDGRMRH